MTTPSPTTPMTDPLPWWRYPMVWLVISGPLVVVVAALATAVIAIRGADVVLTHNEPTRGSGASAVTADSPAMQARNHAATAKP